MRELMMQIGISAVNAFETGNLLCGLGLIWFVMAFITGRKRKAISIPIYIALGIIMFLVGILCHVYAFLESDIYGKITSIAIVAGAAVIGVIIILAGTAIKNNFMGENNVHKKEKQEEQKEGDDHEDQGFE